SSKLSSGKHMTGDRSQLTNFVNKFLGTVKFRNDHVAKILGYGDYQIGNVTISRVYYVEGLGHNLFFVGQFCDSNLEVAFGEGVDLLTGPQGKNLYTLSLGDMMASSPICLLSKALMTNPRGIFINQSKYALESLKKYGFDSCDPVDTPMVEKSKLDEDKEGKAVDPSHYHGMIGTLLYLTAVDLTYNLLYACMPSIRLGLPKST
ncbi:hypothetical protein Tco_1580327, partial [Tanacetum coccineum]